MMQHDDLILSADDAEALAAIVAERGLDPREAAAAAALTQALMDARRVPAEVFPGDRVALEALVSYVEEPAGTRRTVTLVPPGLADAASGRISVLSPVGRALLGRKCGAAASIGLPGGRALTLRVVRIDQPLKAAA